MFDPFMGGGTSLVEARANGRHSLGCDISSLSSFLGKVKTTPLNDADKGASTFYSFNVFSHAIERQHQKRIIAGNKKEELSDSEKDEKRAKFLRWARERNLATSRVGPEDYRWLEDYESK